MLSSESENCCDLDGEVAIIKNLKTRFLKNSIYVWNECLLCNPSWIWKCGKSNLFHCHPWQHWYSTKSCSTIDVPFDILRRTYITFAIAILSLNSFSDFPSCYQLHAITVLLEYGREISCASTLSICAKIVILGQSIERSDSKWCEEATTDAVLPIIFSTFNHFSHVQSFAMSISPFKIEWKHSCLHIFLLFYPFSTFSWRFVSDYWLNNWNEPSVK